MEGRITKQISNQYKVTVNGVDYICSARGKFRNLGLSPLINLSSPSITKGNKTTVS